VFTHEFISVFNATENCSQSVFQFKITLKSQSVLYVSALLGHLQAFVHVLKLSALDRKAMYFSAVAYLCSH
jgi:hypothetical protein